MKNDFLEIDLKKMLYNTLKKWHIMIVMICISAVLFDIYYIYSENSKNTVDIKKYEDALSEKEIGEVEYAHELYEYNLEQYNIINRYIEDSLRMNLDAENLVRYSVQYKIETDNADGSLNSIISTYVKGLKTDELYNEVQEVFDGKLKSQYVSELINVWGNENSGNVSIENTTVDAINISVIASDNNECEKIMHIIGKYISKLYAETQNIYGYYSIEKVFENTTLTVDKDLITEQSEIKEKLTTFKKNMISAKKSFTKTQKEYYELRYPSEEGKELKYINIKFIILGVGVGFVLFFIIYAVKYSLSDKLKNAVELEEKVGLKVFGDAIEFEDKKGIDKYLNLKLNKNNKNLGNIDYQIERVVIEIMLYIRNNNINTLYLVSSCSDSELKEVCNKIKNYPNLKKLNIVVVNEITRNNQSLLKLEDADSVVFVEKIMESDYKDIYDEIELCKMSNKDILGMIIINN